VPFHVCGSIKVFFFLLFLSRMMYPNKFFNHRVLKPNGLYIQITFGQPHFRKPVLHKPEYGWSLEVRTLGRCVKLEIRKAQQSPTLISLGEHWHYYVYVMRRQA